jgi:hypothetical protein
MHRRTGSLLLIDFPMACSRTPEYWTKGAGIGVDLDTQGGLTLGLDYQFIYSANAVSDETSVFAVSESKLKLIQTVYGGD